MAVNQNIPKEIKRYWPEFKTRQVIILFSLNLLIPTLFVGLLFAFGLFELSYAYLIIALTLYLVCIIISYFVFIRSTRPLRDLLSTITYISGEPSALAPLSSSDPRYKNTGMDSAINAIYELSKKSSAETTPSDTTINLLTSALDNTKAGFVVMSGGNVIYANRAAPITVSTDGARKLNLLFQANDNIENWLVHCRENEIKADKIWTRVPDRLPDEENCRYFDVLASYNKDSPCELVLNLIDRTVIYAASEEALNFISFAAHELRGPITVIKGYLDVLSNELKPSLEPDQIEMFERLRVSANTLTSYINNILNTSKYDRRHLKLNLVEENISSIYDVIRDDMNTRANTQRRLLNVSIPTDLPTVAADRASLAEVFSNLIDNAIKYSREGGIINVSAKVSGDQVEISVEDFGIGIPSNVMSNLFTKFYRSHRSRESVSGTGIGLYISKAIVESHGGTIAVKSKEGAGSTFTVILPTYQVMAEKLSKNQSTNEGIIAQGSGWIKNHSLYRG